MSALVVVVRQRRCEEEPSDVGTVLHVAHQEGLILGEKKQRDRDVPVQSPRFIQDLQV